MNKIVPLFALTFIFSGCANMSLNEKPTGEVEARYLDDQEVPGVSYEQLNAKIIRGKNMNMGGFDGAYLEVTPAVGAANFAREYEKIKDNSFKEKWTQEKEEAEIKKSRALIPAYSKNPRCFIVFFRSSNASAYVNPKQWHGELLANGKTYPLTFSEFKGYANVTTKVQGYGSSYTATKSHQYNMVSTACANEPVSLIGGFKVQIEPRFEEDLPKPMLEWTLPGATPKKK